MMQRARRMSLVVVLLLFASAGTAFAECAWVLWEVTDYDAVLEPQWTLIQALPTRPDCIAAVEGRFKAMVEYLKETNSKARAAMDGGSLYVLGPGRSTTAKCFPDTIDPRPKHG